MAEQHVLAFLVLAFAVDAAGAIGAAGGDGSRVRIEKPDQASTV
jgi:hypothetical protein